MNLFAYGSLILPEVMKKVAGRLFRNEEAELHGFARFKFKGKSYPGIMPFPDHSTDGVLYYEVDPETAERLDQFEGNAYERVPVTVATEHGEWADAETYVVRRSARRSLSADAWDEYEFRKEALAEFLSTYPGFDGT